MLKKLNVSIQGCAIESHIKSDPSVGSSQDHFYGLGHDFQCLGLGECMICGMTSMIQHKKDELLGRVLTFLDASIADPRQNQATKDIVRDIIGQVFYGSDGLADNAEELLVKTIQIENRAGRLALSGVRSSVIGTVTYVDPSEQTFKKKAVKNASE